MIATTYRLTCGHAATVPGPMGATTGRAWCDGCGESAAVAHELSRGAEPAHDDLEAIDEDQREAYRAYVETVGAQYATAEDFDEAYAGQWSSLEDYAWELVEGCGMLDGEDETLARYFDVAAFARDLELGGDYWTAPADGDRVYVFRTV